MPTSAGPNPLRPYYIPPANDYLLDSLHSASDAFSRASTSSSSSSASSSVASSVSSVFTSTARDLLSDLDYSEYIDEDNPTPKELVMYKYFSQAVGQPFEVAVVNLQCQYLPKKASKKKSKNIFAGAEGNGSGGGKRGRKGGRFGEKNEDDDDVASVFSDDSEPDYFASNLSEPGSPSLEATSSHSPRRVTDRAGYPLETPDVEEVRQPWELHLHRSSHVWDMLKALWNKEGAWGIWKGQNANFIHWVLESTVNSWTNSLLSAILSIPDPAIGDIADSPNPALSIGVAVASSVIAALVLSPLDIVRTRLMLRALPSWTCPPSLLLPTALYASIPTLILTSRPHIIRHKLGVDPEHSPSTYSFLSFFGSMASRFFRLPLETVLRRGQVDVAKPDKTIVPVGRYAGVFGTMWLIVKEEEGGWGGLEGLFRGWRMEFWPELCLTVLGVVGVGSSGEEGF
ncbi:mitochondrial carrier domain-containing protein [Kalaharituber pfeilii]|nr:mitochondrial carrier domain-containing protein [Kalaharituber pfeilii]